MIDLRPASVCGPILASEIFIYILKKKNIKFCYRQKTSVFQGNVWTYSPNFIIVI